MIWEKLERRKFILQVELNVQTFSVGAIKSCLPVCTLETDKEIGGGRNGGEEKERDRKKETKEKRKK